MRIFETLLASSAIQIFGWMILHSLWQGIFLTFFLRGVLDLSRKTSKISANMRYTTACLTLLLMLILPVSTVLLSGAENQNTISGKTNSRISESNKKDETAFANAAPTESTESPEVIPTFTQFLPVLVLLWFVGVLISSLKLLGVWTYTRRLKTSGREVVSEQLQESFQKLCGQLRVSKAVVLLESSIVKVPTVIGWLKPVVLFPSCALTGLTPQQFEMLLAHELAHVRRYDYLINLIQTTIETLLFYHPAVWWVSKQIRNERENACDDLAVGLGGDAVVYARALVEMERLRKTQTSLAMAADGGSLTTRIHRVVGVETPKSNSFSGLWTVILIGAFLVVVVVAEQKSPVSEEFFNNQSETTAAVNADFDRVVVSDSESRTPVENQNEKKSAKDSAKENDKATEQLTGNNLPANKQETSGEDAENQPENIPERQNDPPDFIEEMASVGYTNLSVNQLVRLRDADITAEYVRSLNAAGFTNLSVDELSRLGINGVSPNYIRAIEGAGYQNLTANQVILIAEHGINADYIAKLRKAGYGNLSIKQLLDFAATEVTPEFVREMSSVGLKNLPPSQIARLSLFGVTPQFVRQAQNRLGNLTVEQIISLKENGLIDKES